MKAILVALSLFLSASKGHGLMLRGIEYDQFSRLVLDAPYGISWSFHPIEGGYAFRFQSSVQFDLSQFFQARSFGRILNVVVLPYGFDLLLACECDAEARSVAGGYLTIDVHERRVLDDVSSKFMSGIDMRQHDYRSRLTINDLWEMSARRAVEPFRRQIFTDLALRGASSERLNSDSVGLPLSLGFHERVSGCPQSDEADVSTWLMGARSGDAFARIRQAADESSDLNSIVEMARAYVALGFGYEAEALLASAPNGIKSSNLLRSIARLAELVPASDPGLSSYADCSGPILVWLALERALKGERSLGDSLDSHAVAAEFDGLPMHLRRNIGPLLMRWFANRKEMEVSDLILASIRRAAVDGSGDMSFIEVEHKILSGLHGEAFDLAVKLLDRFGGSVRQWKAMLLLVEAAVPLARSVPDGTAAALEASLDQAELSGEGERTRRAHLLALALEGQYAQAFSRLDVAPDALPELWRLAAEAAPDEVFLRHSVASPLVLKAERKRVGRAVSIVIARRLVRLGFPEASLGWLGEPIHDAPLDVTDLMAEALLQLRDPAAVLAVLDERGDAAAEEMRARALIQLGQMEQAANALTHVGSQDRQGQAFRWARDWAAAASGAPEAWQAALRLRQEVSMPISPEAPLAQARSLLSNSAPMHSAVSDLLPDAALVTGNNP